MHEARVYFLKIPFLSFFKKLVIMFLLLGVICILLNVFGVYDFPFLQFLGESVLRVLAQFTVACSMIAAFLYWKD